MAEPVKNRRRTYNAPRRAEAAAQTREAILRAAKARFEEAGWVGTTIAAVAADASVSPKTIEATFGTKAALLAAVVDYAIRGDIDPTPMAGRATVQAERDAPDAAAMLDLHAHRSTAIAARAARIASVVETAAQGDARVAELWAQMTHNLLFGVGMAAEILLAKPGVRPGLTREEAEEGLLVAMHWHTYRALTGMRDLTPDGFEDWMRRYYRRMFLPPSASPICTTRSTSGDLTP
jgi:AcrR family transcriptional regulator